MCPYCAQTALEAMKAQRKESARSTQHGNDFETIASEFVEKEAQKSGDIASRTGATTGLIKNCKVGDLVVELGPDCTAAGEKFVVEAKEDASYTLAKARIEIETARKNRGARVGLFLFSAKTAPGGIDMLVRHGEDVFLVWDAEKIESDVILRVGISLAKALCVRQQKDRDDVDSVQRRQEHVSLRRVEVPARRIGTQRPCGSLEPFPGCQRECIAQEE